MIRKRKIVQLENHPLLDHATKYWGYHLARSGERAAEALSLKFLGRSIDLTASMAPSVWRRNSALDIIAYLWEDSVGYFPMMFI